ncbi:MAG: hypothetical protein H6605_03725 [Flavobacteriales bacterium]|nr:hypothetical protein [Flavobacteriales bacterium]
MESIIKIWPYIKIVLEAIFLICCLILPFLLISLALKKKKLVICIDQIEKKETIEYTKDINLAFDPLFVFNLFAELPEIKKDPSLNKNKLALELEEKITILTKIVKRISVILGTTLLLLLVLINWLES